MNKNIYLTTDYYDRNIIQLIISKYGMDPMEAARSFITSKTHAMLENADYGLVSFPVRAVFDMWEAEQTTGNPADSIYIRSE